MQCLNSLAHTELELANRLSVYGDVKEDAMRDGHVWCIIGSARKREQAGDEGGPHAVHRKRKFGKFSQIESNQQQCNRYAPRFGVLPALTASVLD